MPDDATVAVSFRKRSDQQGQHDVGRMPAAGDQATKGAARCHSISVDVWVKSLGERKHCILTHLDPASLESDSGAEMLEKPVEYEDGVIPRARGAPQGRVRDLR